MVRYYFLIAIRNVVRNHGFARLNIAGFAMGLAAFMLITFYVSDELQYDQFNKNHQRIFRVDTNLKYGGIETAFAISAPPVAEALLAGFPEVERAARLSPVQNLRFMKGNEIVREDRVAYADQSLFDIFSLHLLYGNQNGSLKDAQSIVITSSVAKKYFMTEDAVGKTMVLQNDTSIHIITAVIADMPEQSHFHEDIFLPIETLSNSRSTSFNQFTFNTYVLLQSQESAIRLTPKLPSFLDSHLSGSMNVEAFERGGNYIRLLLTPLDDIHLQSNKQRELEPNGDITYVYIFSIVSILILLLACINFTNLFTARSANRAREVGIRKVIGSLRLGIIAQFLIESFVMTAISIVIALAISAIALPHLNALSGKHLEISENTLLAILPFLLLICVLVALTAGIYPALYLSAFKPVKVLRGKLATGFKSSMLRNTLVIAQFSIAMILIVGTLAMLLQIQFIWNKALGFNREQVMIVKDVGSMDHPEVLKEEVKRIAGVMNVSLSGYLPTGGARWQNSISLPEKEGLLGEFWLVDADYIPTLQMKLTAGRNFSSELLTDTAAIILNKSAAVKLGIDEASLGQQIVAGGRKYEFIGVIDDFNYSSLRNNVSPLAMVMGADWQASLVVRVEGAKLKGIISNVEQLWQKVNPGYAFDFSFMDKDFEATYLSEQRMKHVFMIFSGLSIVIAGIGLFGLSAYAAEQRTHEMAVRKVLGASVASLFTLLSMSFLKLVAFAVVISLPISWLAVDKWLSTFAFRVEIPLWVFLSSAAIILAVAGVATTVQTLRTAFRSPSESLRLE